MITSTIPVTYTPSKDGDKWLRVLLEQPLHHALTITGLPKHAAKMKRVILKTMKGQITPLTMEIEGGGSMEIVEITVNGQSVWRATT